MNLKKYWIRFRWWALIIVVVVVFYVLWKAGRSSSQVELIEWANRKKVKIIEEAISNEFKSSQHIDLDMVKIDNKLKEIRKRQENQDEVISNINSKTLQELEELFIDAGY